MNILIPMAGRGSRFQTAGYTFPKPLIEVRNKTMVDVVVSNLDMKSDRNKHIYLVLDEHYDKYSMKELLPIISLPSPCEIVRVSQVTEGAACTTLLAKELINNDEELVIANSDQWVNWSSSDFIKYMRDRSADGGILTFYSNHPKWSFVRVDELSNKILEVAEKRPISTTATVGIYYFKHGKDFVSAAERMISRKEKVNGEYYVAPTYNQMIEDGKTILNYPVSEMMGLGTPEDLDAFLEAKKI